MPPLSRGTKIFHSRLSSPSFFSSRNSIFPIFCLMFGIAGLAFGIFSFTTPIRGKNCASREPRSISVVWERGHTSPSSSDGGIDDANRHKVMGFVGIFTGFGSVGRRRALRQTWLPSNKQGLERLEEATGLAFRFVIGRTNDNQKMSMLQKEVAEYDDFLLLDLDEQYNKLPYKTLAFFKAAYALFDSEFYVKADDDIYLRPDRLSLLLAKERSNPQTYIGCMKKGPVFTNQNMKWYEPLSYLLGKEYFLHAYGPSFEDFREFRESSNKSRKVLIEIGRRMADAQTLTCIEILLAIVLPPLGVFLKFECRAEFWICVLLTLFGWLPGIIYAIWVLTK